MQSQKLSKLPKANMPDDQRPTHQPINPPKPPSGNPLAYGLIELIEHWALPEQGHHTTPRPALPWPVVCKYFEARVCSLLSL